MKLQSTYCQASWGLWHRIWDSQSRLPERISIAAKVKHGSNYGIGKDALIDSSLLILLPWCIILAAQVHFPKSVLHYSTSYFSCTLLSTETYASNRCLFAIYLKQWHWKIQSLWQETEKAKLWTCEVRCLWDICMKFSRRWVTILFKTD